MRTVHPAITAARQSNASRLCKIWRIERRDGTVRRFTEHDRDLTVDGETFEATASFDPSTIKAGSDLSVDDLDVQGAFDSSYITAEDLTAGRYYGASFFVAEVLWDNTSVPMDVLRLGWMGRVKESGGKFVAELLGLTAPLQQPMLRVYATACDATLGDSRCKVDLGPFTQEGEVTSSSDARIFAASGLTLPEPGYFDFGKVTWTSGPNAGLSMDVGTSDGTNVALFWPMPFQISAGDTFSITAGCNKSLGQCISRFANKLNHRGHPHVPVNDDLIKGPVPGASTPAATPPSSGDGSGSDWGGGW